MKILIDGYNLDLEQGTGISTYARNLSYILKDITTETQILYGKNIVSKNALLKEIEFFDSIKSIGKYHLFLQKINRIKQAIIYPFFGLASNEISITNVVIKEHFKQRLPHFDRIYNSINIYSVAHIYFKLTGQFLEINIPQTPDIAHWTYPLPIKIRGAKNIYTLHDLVPLRLPYTTLDNKKDYFKLVSKIAKYADKIVTVSEHSKSDIINILNVPSESVVNTYQLVSIPDKYKNIEEPELTILLESFFNLEYKNYILFVGAIEPKKNVGKLLEAYLGLKTDIPLVMVGPEAWMAETELAILREEDITKKIIVDNEIKLKKRVKRLGYVSFSMLVKLIKGARFLTFPSLYEGFGLPILEAMSLGTPVLTSKVSCIPEVTKDAAYLVDPYDILAIRKGINDLITDQALLDELSKKGLAQANTFNHDSYKNRLLNLYQNI
jgi:glycosyltransferase involved in cell wall biosynthesis